MIIKYVFEFIFNIKDLNKQIENWANFELINFSITHSRKLLNRFRTSLIKEQENLSNSDESSQHDIIKQIEYYEMYIGKLSSESEILPIEVFKLFLNLYNEVKESETKKSYIFERIVQICRNYKVDIVRNFDGFKHTNGEIDEEIDSLLNNIKNI